MKEYGLPTADFVTVNNVKSLGSVLERFPAIQTLPITNRFCRVPWNKSVVKADGLAAGKGVIIPNDMKETEAAARSMLEVKLNIGFIELMFEYSGKIRRCWPDCDHRGMSWWVRSFGKWRDSSDPFFPSSFEYFWHSRLSMVSLFAECLSEKITSDFSTLT